MSDLDSTHRTRLPKTTGHAPAGMADFQSWLEDEGGTLTSAPAGESSLALPVVVHSGLSLAGVFVTLTLLSEMGLYAFIVLMVMAAMGCLQWAFVRFLGGLSRSAGWFAKAVALAAPQALIGMLVLSLLAGYADAIPRKGLFETSLSFEKQKEADEMKACYPILWGAGAGLFLAGVAWTWGIPSRSSSLALGLVGGRIALGSFVCAGIVLCLPVGSGVFIPLGRYVGLSLCGLVLWYCLPLLVSARLMRAAAGSPKICGAKIGL